MIACLSLVQHSHARVECVGSRSVTACGLAIEEEHVTPALFVEYPAVATCPQCRRAGSAAAPVASRVPLGIDSFARRLIETIVGSNEPDELGSFLLPAVADWFTPDRIQRLHDLFPGLGIAVDEVLAQNAKAMVRYTVTCHDRSGLIGPPGLHLRLRQAVVLELADGLLARADPLIDDFSLWKRPAPGGPAA